MNNSIMKNVSFHDQEVLDMEINNNDLVIIAKDNDTLGKKYIFNVKNAKIETNATVNINEIKGNIIMTLSYHEFNDKDNYIHLELFNKNTPFYDEFYIYSNDIIISTE